MDNVLLKFGLCIVAVIDNDSKFVSVFTQMCKALTIYLCRVATYNHKVVGVERYFRYLNHASQY